MKVSSDRIFSPARQPIWLDGGDDNHVERTDKAGRIEMTVHKNWKDSTVFIGDNLHIMRGMNSGQIDLIYLDPPFNSNHDYAAPIGSEAAGAAFKDTWTLQDLDDAWYGYIADKHPALYSILDASGLATGDSVKSYLIYMAIRILEMKRLLKPTGSIYLHCDPTMSHYLKVVMDAIFDRRNFRNEIFWQRYSGRAKGNQYTPKTFGVHNDNLLFYVKNRETKLVDLYTSLSAADLNIQYPKIDAKGRRYTEIAHFRGKNMAPRPSLCYTWRGYTNPHPSGWRVCLDVLEKEYQDGKVVIHKNGRLERRRFYDPQKGVVLGNIWTDIQPPKKGEVTGYPTQKPLELLKRIIKASSNKGDVVFDPFCGCGTTCIAAQDLDRKWVACDISQMAGELVVKRMEKELGMFYEGEVRNDFPKRTSNDLTAEENEVFGDAKIERCNSLNNKYQLFGKQGGRCNGCGLKLEFKLFEIDHIIPQVLNGSDHISNLQLLCGPCNSSKGVRPTNEFMAQKRDELERQLKIHDGLLKKKR